MSRNIGTITCYFCNEPVKLLEEPRLPTAKEVGVFREYLTSMFAKAECPLCLAQYFAWCSINTGISDNLIKDLSFYHSFNDEPDERDLPRYIVERVPVRVGIFNDSSTFRLGKDFKR